MKTEDEDNQDINKHIELTFPVSLKLMKDLDGSDTASNIDVSSYLTRWMERTKSLLLYGDVDSTFAYRDRYEAGSIKYVDPDVKREALSPCNHDGQSIHDNRGYIQRLEIVISEVINDMDAQKQRQRFLLSHLVSMNDGLSVSSPILDTSDLFIKLRHYKRLTLKYELLKLSKAIAQLQRYQHVRDIPSLVFSIRGNDSLMVLSRLRIYKLIKDTVKNIKSTLLTQFHKLFEEHLLDTQLGDSGSNDSSNKSSLWMVFLTEARDWLLAYALVTLLPVVLTETDSMVLDAFKEALDEALTPIWGRFHYHLEIARQAKSSLQIVWTFNYCKSFVQMICDLSEQMTSSGELKLLCNVDYANAGLQQVLQKAVKFMRAHIAITITEFSPLTQELCIQVVEETLELDHWFYDQASLFPGYSRSNANSLDTICPVLYDSKETFHQWITVEHDHCKSRLRFKLSKPEKIFSFRFAHPRSSYRGSTMIIGSTGQYRCYSGVFDCIGLFFTMCHRYVHLPDPAQRILSVYILEPLLCSIIALLLYRIRSNRTLFKISLGSYTHNASTTDGSSIGVEAEAKHKVSYPQEFLEFIDSAQYVQACLSGVDDRVRCIKARSSTLFRTECWSTIQTWIPKVLINRQEQLDGEHSTVELIEKIWSLSDDLIHSRSNYSYRSFPLVNQRPAESSSIKMGRPNTTDVKHADWGMGCIGDSIHVAKSLAITLCNVMNTQMKSNVL